MEMSLHPPKQNIMTRPLKLWEAVVATLGILLTVGIMIYNRGTQDATNSGQIQMLKLQQQEYKTQLDQLNNKLDKNGEQLDTKLNGMNDKITSILVALQDKQNRKN